MRKKKRKKIQTINFIKNKHLLVGVLFLFTRGFSMSLKSFHVVLVKSNIPSVILTEDSDKYLDQEGMDYIGVLNDSCAEPENEGCLILKGAIGQMLSALNKDYYKIKWDNKKNIMDKLVISFDGEDTNEQ